MFYTSLVFVFYINLLFYSQYVCTPGDCGAPGYHRLTQFKVINKNTSNSNQTKYTNGTVIRYKCKDNNYELVDRESDTRVCVDGMWSKGIPVCAQPFNNNIIAKYIEIFDDLGNKSIEKENLKNNQPQLKRAYFVEPWPDECEDISLKDTTRQSFVIHLNHSVFFNFIQLSIGYPDLSPIDINEPKITITSYVYSITNCTTFQAKRYVVKKTVLDTVYIKCKFNQNISTKDTINLKESKIKLSFKIESKNKTKTSLKISVCEIKLFKYPTNECGEPDRPLNTWVSSAGDYTQFTCNDGYDIKPYKSSGYHVLCDINSEWVTGFPVCIERQFCYLFENSSKYSPKVTYTSSELSFAVINERNTTKDNTIASFSCENITINGSETVLNPSVRAFVVCKGGKWSYPGLPECKPITANILIQSFNQNFILISIVCMVLLGFIIILLSIIIFCIKNKSKKQLNEVKMRNDWSIPTTGAQVVYEQNNYESIRMSNYMNALNYDHIYEDVDQSYQRVSNNTIYETDDKSNGLWVSNSYYS